MLNFFKNRKVYIFKCRKVLKRFEMLKFKKVYMSYLFSLHRVFNMISHLVIKGQIQVHHWPAPTSSFSENTSGTKRMAILWRGIRNMTFLISFHPLEKNWAMWSLMKICMPLIKFLSWGKWMYLVRLLPLQGFPGVHYQHLEAVASGWKLDFF